MIEKEERNVNFIYREQAITLQNIERVEDLGKLLGEIYGIDNEQKKIVGVIDENYTFYDIKNWEIDKNKFNDNENLYLCIANKNESSLESSSNINKLLDGLYHRYSKQTELIDISDSNDENLDIFNLLYQIHDLENFLQIKSQKCDKCYCIILLNNMDPLYVDLSITNTLEKINIYCLMLNQNNIKIANDKLIWQNNLNNNLSEISEKILLLQGNNIIDENAFVRNQEQFMDTIQNLYEKNLLYYSKEDLTTKKEINGTYMLKNISNEILGQIKHIYNDFLKRRLLNFFDYLELVMLLEYNEDFGNYVSNSFKQELSHLEVIEHGLKHKNNYRVDTRYIQIKDIIEIIITIQDCMPTISIDPSFIKTKLLNLELNLSDDLVSYMVPDKLSRMQKLIDDVIIKKYSINQFLKKLNNFLSDKNVNNNHKKSNAKSIKTNLNSMLRNSSSNEVNQELAKINTFDLTEIYNKLEHVLSTHEFQMVKNLVNKKDNYILNAINLYNEEKNFYNFVEKLQIIIKNNDLRFKTKNFKEDEKVAQNPEYFSLYKKEEIPENIILTFGARRQTTNLYQSNYKELMNEIKDKAEEDQSPKFQNHQRKIYQARASKNYTNDQPIEVVIEMIKTDSENKSDKKESNKNSLSVQTVKESNKQKNNTLSNANNTSHSISLEKNNLNITPQVVQNQGNLIHNNNSDIQHDTNIDKNVFTNQNIFRKPDNGSAKFISGEKSKINGQFFDLRRKTEYISDTTKNAVSPFKIMHNSPLSPVSPIKASFDNSISDYAHNFLHLNTETKNEDSNFFKFMHLARKEKKLNQDTKK